MAATVLPLQVLSASLQNCSSMRVRDFVFRLLKARAAANHANSFFFLAYPISPESSGSPSCRKEDENNVISLSLSILSLCVTGYITQSKRLGLLPQPSRTFTLEELKEATDSFNPAAFVGEGSHGKVKSFWQIFKLWSWSLHLGEEHNIKT